MRKVPLEPSFGEVKDLSSTFDAGLFSMQNVDDFKNLYDAFKKKFPKADHYPYAYSLNGLSKSSDDGEPGGTGGRPLIALLEDKDVDGLLIVARYFGGTKLGIPRLRRAFVDASTLAIENARLGQYKEAYAYELDVDYSLYETLNAQSRRHNYRIESACFDINVHVEIRSSGRLDGLGEAIGVYDLDLGEPRIILSLEEIRHDSC